MAGLGLNAVGGQTRKVDGHVSAASGLPALGQRLRQEGVVVDGEVQPMRLAHQDDDLINCRSLLYPDTPHQLVKETAFVYPIFCSIA